MVERRHKLAEANVKRWATIGVAMAAGCDPGYHRCGGDIESREVTATTVDGVPVFEWDQGAVGRLLVREVKEGKRGNGALVNEPMWGLECWGDRPGDRFEDRACIEAPLAYGEPIDPERLDPRNQVESAPLVSGTLYNLFAELWTEKFGPLQHCGVLSDVSVDFVAP